MTVKRLFKGNEDITTIVMELLELEIEKLMLDIYNNKQVDIVATGMEGDKC